MGVYLGNGGQSLSSCAILNILPLLFKISKRLVQQGQIFSTRYGLEEGVGRASASFAVVIVVN
jgi:hypothetical protein